MLDFIHSTWGLSPEESKVVEDYNDAVRILNKTDVYSTESIQWANDYLEEFAWEIEQIKHIRQIIDTDYEEALDRWYHRNGF